MQSQQNGALIIDGNVKIASITDGTSNTFIFGEKAHGYFAQFDAIYQTTPRRGRPACTSTRFSQRPILPTCQRPMRPGLTPAGSSIISRPMQRATTPAA